MKFIKLVRKITQKLFEYFFIYKFLKINEEDFFNFVIAQKNISNENNMSKCANQF